MKQLTLLRHAKSGWDDPVARDFDRALNARGRAASQMIGDYAAAQGLAVDAVHASPAVRVTETLDIFLPAAGLGAIEPHWDRRIYLASAVTLMDVLRELPDTVEHVLMAGHNPGMEDLILELAADDGASPLRDGVEERGFPTAGLARLALDVPQWSALTERCGRIVELVRPKDLDPQFASEED